MNRKTRILFLLLALLLPLAAQAQQAQEAGKAPVETVQFKSKLVGAALPYNVILPVDYASPAARTTRYPVLYLLHGLAGHYSDWTSHSKLASYAAQYHLIVVTPEGNDGWYTDSPTVSTDKYESYIVQELIPDVEGRYRTIAAREGRAIAGLSMGGYGALKFGVKYPQMFSFAASMSGALMAASWKESELKTFPWPLVPLTVKRAFGPDDNPTHAANDLFKLFRDLPAERVPSLPYFYLDCGTEDGLLAGSRELSGIFMEKKIPHEYRQLPGKHEWPYWDQQIRDILRIAAQKTGKTVTSDE
ncbi:MAG TPA: alpha/beta hydrolase family protein [Pyrinomonadaceae bacterium]|jgi:S-formylglutathione hydrolase FrmB|nr:alpha/beta hydrolase family protein [Pyrinomonadaceae bacterium]